MRFFCHYFYCCLLVCRIEQVVLANEFIVRVDMGSIPYATSVQLVKLEWFRMCLFTKREREGAGGEELGREMERKRERDREGGNHFDFSALPQLKIVRKAKNLLANRTIGTLIKPHCIEATPFSSSQR